MRTVRLRVRLRGVEPLVERVVDVPASATLPELHQVLQAAMGWVDVHLHEFVSGSARYGVPDPDGLDDLDEEPVRDEALFGLRELGERWTYRYDFGDDWTHDVEVVGAGGDCAGCIDGCGGCPLEDCGGAPGWAELRMALADPGHSDRAPIHEWAGGALPDFDREATDLLVRQIVGAVPESVQLLFELVGDGVRLTPSGRLPRQMVRAVQEQRPAWGLTARPAGFEEDLIPLAAMHDMLRGVGLLRLRHGALRAIKAASDDLEVVRRLRSWFDPPGGFVAYLVSTAVAVLAVEGPESRETLAERVLGLLGPGWARGGRPITAYDVARELSRIGPVLEGCDQIVQHGALWHPGSAARWLLPRATALAALWSPDTRPTQPHYAGG